MNTKIKAKTKKQLQSAILRLQFEVKKADDLIRQLQEIRKQFRGFQKLESLVTKTWDHENALNGAQAWVRVSIEKFENCKDQDEALSELLTAPNRENYEDLQRQIKQVIEEWKHIKKSLSQDKKLLNAIKKSREKWFTGELTFFG